MWGPLGPAIAAALGLVGGFALGAWVFRRRERATAAVLAARDRELQDLRTELVRLSALDGLTALASHQYAQEFLEREWRRALRELTPLSVILADIDRFKAYNEHMGHEAGDACLKRIAGVMRETINRPGDLVARYGGEEILVVLGRTDSPGAESLAARLRAAVEDLGLSHPASDVGDRVTITLGVATAYPTRGAPWQDLDLLAAAERALATAKAQGRNRVVLAAPTEIPG